jgi:hypothetical protein
MAALWRGLELLGVGVAVFVGGAAAGLTAAWMLSRVGRRFGRDEVIDGLIKAPEQRFDGHDEKLRESTEKRRDVADRMRRRAAHVESGAPAAEVTKLAERRR